jgi:protein-S-isoprenylcysteine O-methyltransferase Ste14
MTADPILRILSLGALVAAIGVSGYHRARADREGGALPPPPADQPSVLLRATIGVLVLGSMLQAAFAPRAVPWLIAELPAAARWAGLAMAWSSIPILWWAFHSIGLNISPSSATRVGATLVTHGPYRWVRHPVYSVGGFAFLGVALALGSLVMAAFVAAAILWLPARVRHEEANLIASHGDRYRTYMRATGRFLPRLPNGAE